jgi:hypothetical protein
MKSKKLWMIGAAVAAVAVAVAVVKRRRANTGASGSLEMMMTQPAFLAYGGGYGGSHSRSGTTLPPSAARPPYPEPTPVLARDPYPEPVTTSSVPIKGYSPRTLFSVPNVGSTPTTTSARPRRVGSTSRVER